MENKNEKNYIPQKNRRYRDSFKYAFTGVRTVFQEERNMRVHVITGAIALILGLVFPLTRYEWLWILLASFNVIVMEIWNTVVENIIDFLTTEYHPTAKKVKDMSAAAVLISTIFAVISGALIFIPKIIELLS